MRITVLLVLVVAIAFVGPALAVPPGKSIEYEGGWAGKVVYDGKTHGEKQGIKCTDCHPAIFPMKRAPAGTYNMKDMIAGENCGVCHNGEKAFSSSDFASCAKCHKEEPTAPPSEAPSEEPAAPAEGG